MFSAEDDRPYHMGVGSRIAGVVQGYRPQVDWGGDAGSATIVVGGHNVKVATPGWRRRCLYLLLVALLVLSIVNLSLTLLVLKTTYFSVDGMGDLHISVGGLDMEGTTRFLGKVTAGQITSKRGSRLLMEGYHNLTIAATAENDNFPDTFLHLGVDSVSAGGNEMTVETPNGQPLFKATKDDMLVGADKLTVTGSQGAILKGSLQTPILYSRGTQELRLESVTGSVSGRAAKEVSLEARDGDISLVSSNDLTLGSKLGGIRFDNPKIYMTELLTGSDSDSVTPTVTPQETQLEAPPMKEDTSSSSSSSSDVQVYQVCVCPNGRLFLMEATVMCQFADNICR